MARAPAKRNFLDGGRDGRASRTIHARQLPTDGRPVGGESARVFLRDARMRHTRTSSLSVYRFRAAGLVDDNVTRPPSIGFCDGDGGGGGDADRSKFNEIDASWSFGGGGRRIRSRSRRTVGSMTRNRVHYDDEITVKYTLGETRATRFSLRLKRNFGGVTKKIFPNQNTRNMTRVPRYIYTRMI